MNLTEKKTQEAVTELQIWLEKPNAKKERFTSIIDEINNKINTGTVTKSIFRQFDYLDFWYSNNYVYDYLTKEKTDYQTKIASNGYHVIVISDFLARKYISSPPYLLFNNVSYWLANCLLQRWYAESNTLLKIINTGLNTKFLKGGLNFKLTAWFILEIANKGYDIFIDYSNFNYPKDMKIYREALDNWNTHDISLVSNIMNKLCDFHLSNASFGDGDNVAEIQFDRACEFVFAYEILAWLSIREMKGLSNPETFSHPLMNLKLNKLPKMVTPLRKDDLFERVLIKLKSENAS